MIFTCNFANWRKIPVEVTPISIANFPPRDWPHDTYPPFFPPKDLMNLYKEGRVDSKLFRESYTLHVLDKLNPSEVVLDLYTISSNNAVALLCYESYDKFCHRHIVRGWLQSFGFTCEEFKVKTALKFSLGLRKDHD